MKKPNTEPAILIVATALVAIFAVAPVARARTRWHPPVVRALSPEEREFAGKRGIPHSDREKIRREMKREKEEIELRNAEEARAVRETKRIGADSANASCLSRGSVCAGWTFANIVSSARPGSPRAAIVFRYAESCPEIPANVVFEWFPNSMNSGLAIKTETGADAARFAAALRAVSEKMAAWQQVAQANGVTDLVKEFPEIDWPEVSYRHFMWKAKPVAEYVIRKKTEENGIEYLCRLSLKRTSENAGNPETFIEMDKAGMDSFLSLLPKVVPALEAEKCNRDKTAAAEKNKADLFR